MAVLPHSSVAVSFTLKAAPASCSEGVGTLSFLAAAALTVDRQSGAVVERAFLDLDVRCFGLVELHHAVHRARHRGLAFGERDFGCFAEAPFDA